jgi:hypothetical protein
MTKDKIELAKKHVELAEQLISEEANNAKNDKETKELTEAQFALEKAESEIQDLEEM